MAPEAAPVRAANRRAFRDSVHVVESRGTRGLCVCLTRRNKTPKPQTETCFTRTLWLKLLGGFGFRILFSRDEDAEMPRRSHDEENAPRAEPSKKGSETKRKSMIEAVLAYASKNKSTDADHRDGAVGRIERGNTEMQARTIRLFRSLRLPFSLTLTLS